MPIIPTATFLAVVTELGQKVGAEQVQLDITRMKRHFDLLCELMHKARKLGIKLLVGTDTGNNTFTTYGDLHAKELEIFVKYGGYSPMEAIVRGHQATMRWRSVSKARSARSPPASSPT